MASSCRRALTITILVFGFLSLSGAEGALLSTDVRRARTIANHKQQSAASQHDPTQACNISVGFSLQSSYAAVAVIFDRADGTKDTVIRTLDGGVTYRKVMAYLSLESSQHLA